MDGIAVVGMAGRFPGAKKLEEFWKNLRDGRETISRFNLGGANSEEGREQDGPVYVGARGMIGDVEYFDADFFRFTPREAEITDPQHRLFLECTWEALEHAGYNPRSYPGYIGLYAGTGPNMYALRLAAAGRAENGLDAFQVKLHNRSDHLPGRVAYKLGFRGPCVAVQTACSTSLVAVVHGCQSLLTHQCDIALAGGVNISVPERRGYAYHEFGIMSPDGHCRAFSEGAQGTVPGNGAGVVVLKRLSDAIEGNDTIHAVIRGWGLNNDGADRVGYTAPGVRGQTEVIAAAHALAGISADEISYVEAHGTGTDLGDRIEIRALSAAFRPRTTRKSYCALGSVKTNIGHLDAAAGVAGLIKTILALKHKEIPPSLHCRLPNPTAAFEGSPFFVSTGLRVWRSDGLRRAGVSSFGLGGTNAHVVVEESRDTENSDSAARSEQLLVLSARTGRALDRMTTDLVTFLRNSSSTLADVAFTLQVGRERFSHRRSVSCSSREDAIPALESLDPKKVVSAVEDDSDRRIAFLFPGQGAEYPGMAAELYRREPIFRDAIDQCIALVQPHLTFDLWPMLLGGDAATTPSPVGIDDTIVTQPCLFVTTYALARLWESWGVRPAVMLGHSLGEYVAACLAGVMSLSDALELVAARGMLMQRLPAGAMLVVRLSERDLARRLAGMGLSIAAVNGRELCVVAGDVTAIARLREMLVEERIDAHLLKATRAFHSGMVQDVLEPFRRKLEGIELRPPTIPFVSSMTGDWVSPEEVATAEYWVQHLRRTVKFEQALGTLLQDPNIALLEVGPGRTLGALARRHRAIRPEHVILSSLSGKITDKSEAEYMLETLGRLWLAGVVIDWDRVHAGGRRRRIPLPTYPFERRPYWIEHPNRSAPPEPSRRDPMELPEAGALLYQPTWKQSNAESIGRGQAQVEDASPWLIFSIGAGVGGRMADYLAGAGMTVITVEPGDGYRRAHDDRFVVRPSERDDYRNLIAELDREGRLPKRILHFWSADLALASRSTRHAASFLLHGLHSLISLAQALGEAGVAELPFEMTVVSAGMESVIGGDSVWPEQATMLGPVRTIPREYGNVKCVSIDIDNAEPDSVRERWLIQQICTDTMTIGQNVTRSLAYRGWNRWTKHYETMPSRAAVHDGSYLRRGGTYLITGGLGGIGLEIAEYLVRSAAAKLVLVGRSPLPPREEWDRHVGRSGVAGSLAGVIERIRSLEQLGADILVGSLDVADQAGMRNLVDRAEREFGKIRGVIHAAGVAGGGLMQFRRLEDVNRVLRAKVHGTRVLEGLFDWSEVDFFALCSSRTALAGGVGQVDYAGANAFLDAFAHYHRDRTGASTVSINWEAWADVGMAARTREHRYSKDRAGNVTSASHPFLGQCVVDQADRRVYATEFGAEDWIVAEHRIRGQPVMPGLAYFEVVRAGLGELARGKVLHFIEMFFPVPLVFAEGERKQVQLEITGAGGAYTFRVWSGAHDNRIEHAIGRVRLERISSPRRNLERLRRECSVEVRERVETRREADLGPRWQSVKRLHLGTGQLLLELELPQRFHKDFEDLMFHPAILDRAAGIAKHFLAGEGRYLPYAYTNVRIHGSLCPKTYTFSRYYGAGARDGETIEFDFAIVDERGHVLVEVERFVQKRLRDWEKVLATNTSGSELMRGGSGTPDGAAHVDRGLTPARGIAILERVLSSCAAPQVVVSSEELQAYLDRKPSLDALRPTVQRAEAEDVSRSRPELRVEFSRPCNELEQTLASTWEEVLGIVSVGIYDDFFALGGDSIQAIQIISRVNMAGIELTPQMFFELRTVAALAEGLQRQTTDGVAAVKQPTIRVGHRREQLDLSFAQQRLWFLEQLGAVGAAYNLPIAVRLRGNLDRKALGRALDRIVERHEALRTTFVKVDGVPVLRIGSPAEYEFRLLNLDMSRHDEAELGRLVAEEGNLPFELEQGPLVRGRLIRMGQDDHMLLVTMHHIVSDGWSMGVLFNELSALYEAFRSGRGDPLPALPVQYADYVAWQREWVEGELLEAQAEYWAQTLTGVPELLQLPTDHPRPARQDYAGDVMSVVLDEQLTAGLKALSQRHGTTLFMTLLAGWAAVLSWLSGRGEVVVGTPAANRGRAEIEGLIGFFVNTLALRIDLTGTLTVAELLERVKRRSLEAQQNQDIPFEQVVELVQPVRNLAHSALFQVMFAWQSMPWGRLELPGLRSDFVGAMPYGTAKFDLSLRLREVDGRIAGSIEYATSLFERATIERHVGYFRGALEAMVADERQLVERLALLPEAERRQVVEGWNATAVDYPREKCVHELFEAQAGRTPDAMAVVFEDEALSYGELNARANRLARHLQNHGVEPDARVAVYVERSVEMVAAVLGVLKAGGAYVPLDPEYPEERLRYMLADSAPVALLTQARLAERFAELDVPVVVLDVAQEWSSQVESAPARRDVRPEDLAYVIYTSGSTGWPKGVMVTHRSVVNVVSWMGREWGLETGESVLQKTPYSFDASVRELIPPLLEGGRLVVARPGGQRDARYLSETIRRERIDTLHFVPSMLQVLIEEGGLGGCPDLKRVVCGGEALGQVLRERVWEQAPQVQLFNVYGPTEATVDVTAWRCGSEARAVSMPIGRPMANAQVFILDSRGEPMPVGVAGELYIGGIQVARGYRNRPALTAERFVADPFGGEPGARLYRTGDLARWLGNGTLEFVGRTDLQVKVRGFRVELGEIERRLAEHPAVREAVVAVREEAPSDRRLVAYYVGEVVEAEALRSHLSERLPDYMVPAAYVRLMSLPLTANGKVDRRALPAPDEGALVRRGYEAPVGETEAALAEIWAELLGVERVGRWDHFFELGGHSLLAIRLIERMRRRGLHAEVHALFTAPTLCGVAGATDHVQEIRV